MKNKIFTVCENWDDDTLVIVDEKSHTIAVMEDMHDKVRAKLLASAPTLAEENKALLLEVKRLKEAVVAIASDAYDKGFTSAMGIEPPNKQEYLNSIK